MKLVKWLLGGVAVIVVLIVAAVVILPQVVPMERVVAEATAKVEAKTGRKLVVGGKPELSLWPEVAIRLNDVAFANAPGAPDANMATAEAVRIAVPILPLISGAVEVKEFVLVKPDIRLYVDAKGKPNWDFGGGKAKPAETVKDKDDDHKAGLPDGMSDFKLGDVRIESGRISYTDARTGATEVVENVDLAITLPSLEGPLDLKGGLAWKGERIALELAMASPAAAASGGKSALKTKVSGSHLDMSFDGEANFADGFALAGAAGIKTPSIKKLSAWAAAPIAVEGDILGPFEANGRLAFAKGRIAFTGATLAIDAIRGKGDFALNTAGAVPAITAKLALGELNLNPYLPAPKADPAAGGDSGPGKWSEEPIDLSGLKAASADLDLSVERLLVQDIKVGQSQITAKLRGGVLDLNLVKMALYDGAGVGTIKVDASKATPRISESLKLTGIQAGPLLADAAGFDKLSGAGDLELAVNATGVSEAAMVKSAQGGGAFAFKNGAIKGFNLGAMVRKVEGAFLDASAGKQQQTDFSELTATFKIKDGVATNDDLFMLSPLFRVTGKGQTSLPARTVNYRVEPKAVASTTGQGGATDLSGVAVPVLITGPWHDLSYAPDLSGMALDAIKGVAGGAADIVKDPGKAVEGVLKDGAGAVGGAADGAAKQLKGLFGK